MKLENVVVYKVGEVQTVGTTGFQKREIILIDGVETHYPQHISVEATKDKTSDWDDVNAGATVTVELNLRGRLWTDPKTGQEKAFNSLQVWKMDVVSAAPAVQEKKDIWDEAPKAGTPKENPLQPSSVFTDDSGDLPF